MKLYDPAAHEPLLIRPWSEREIRATINAIVSETEAAYEPGAGWPAHPDDYTAPNRDLTLYEGAIGTIWGLRFLQRSAPSTAVSFDACRAAREVLSQMPATVDGDAWYPSSLCAGLLGGELLVALLSATTEALDTVEARLGDDPDDSNEFFTGRPGGMLAARFLFERTQEERWRRIFLCGFDQLMARWEEQQPGVFLWHNALYGNALPVVSYIGPGHGFAGNVAICLGSGLLDLSQTHEVRRRAISTALSLALRAEGRVNWPAITGIAFPAERCFEDGAPKHPMQWCHGAPGTGAALTAIPRGLDESFDRLLLEAGETVWEAGPLQKGSGLCHGTAGNGFTFLKLHRRTGDPIWLERARAFGAHAVEQMRAERIRWGSPRFSLFTGEVGVAIFLSACLSGDDRMPVVDAW